MGKELINLVRGVAPIRVSTIKGATKETVKAKIEANRGNFKSMIDTKKSLFSEKTLKEHGIIGNDDIINKDEDEMVI